MTEDMQVRNLSSQTQATYVQQVSLFARHFNKSPEILGPEEKSDRIHNWGYAVFTLFQCQVCQHRIEIDQISAAAEGIP
jgi:hypothetical protein